MAEPPVVLVHGLWMNGLDQRMLGRRLHREHGFDVHVFAYRSLRGEFAALCGELAEFAAKVAVKGQVHLVGHSLGGALVLRTLSDCGGGFSGNAVLLGSPLNGSRAALGAMRHRMIRPLLGPHVRNELATLCERNCPGPGAVGAIAGTRRVGTGQFFTHFDEDNDGTVAVSETVIPGLADHLVLNHSHIGMLFARDVADQVAYFLRDGRFLHEQPPQTPESAAPAEPPQQSPPGVR